MKIKGFTLIELLAVIVILAIIALIATPIILNIIEDTKESANIRSAELYIDSLQTTIASKNMQSEFKPNQCTITNKITTCDGVTLNVVTEETMPTSGTIKFENGKVISATIDFNGEGVVLNNGKYEEAETFTVIYENIEVLDSYPTTIVKTGDLIIDFKVNTIIEDVKVDGVSITGFTFKNNILTLKNIQGNVEIVGLPPIGTGVTISVSGNVPQGNFEPGDEYVIQVNDTYSYNFFVLSDNNDGTVNMIMDRGILKNGGMSDSSNRGYVEWYSDGSSNTTTEFGPVTALNFLHESTKDWDYIDNIVLNHTDVGTSKPYKKIVTENNITKIYKSDGTTVTGTYVNLKARLLTYQEAVDVGCLTHKYSNDEAYSSCPMWLANYLTSSPTYYNGGTNVYDLYAHFTLDSCDHRGVWAVRYTGQLKFHSENYGTNQSSYGSVRPVITVKKRQLVLPTESK